MNNTFGVKNLRAKSPVHLLAFWQKGKLQTPNKTYCSLATVANSPFAPSIVLTDGIMEQHFFISSEMLPDAKLKNRPVLQISSDPICLVCN